MRSTLENPARGHGDHSLPKSLNANEMLHPNRMSKQKYEALHEVKKFKQEQDFRQAPLFFFIGLSLSLLMVTTAINWKSYDKTAIMDLGMVEADFDDLIEVPPSEQPPPPPPQQKMIMPEIVEVDDEELIEEIEIDLDVEMTEEQVVEDIIPDFDAVVEEEVEEIFTIVEDLPEPVGGMSSFYSYIGENLKYPKEARRLGIEGMVFVKFVVEKNGSISDVSVIKGIGAGCDKEAIRVLEGAPAWKPGKQRGRAVRVYMTVPIRFVLANNS